MVVLIIMVGLVLRIANLNQSFWLDEAAQVIESARPLTQQLDIAGDFWPPLYHLLLHFWMYGGKSEVWVRLLSVTFSLLTIFFVYLLVKELTSRKVALLTALLTALGPFDIWYAQEARPYALSALLGIATTYFLITRKFKSYTLSAILFLFTTYMAPFLLLAHGVYVRLFEQKFRIQWLTGLLISAGAFGAWMPSFIRQLQIGTSLTGTLPGWSEAVSTPLYRSLPLTFAKFLIGRITFDDKIFYAGLVAGAAVIFALLLRRAYLMQKEVILKTSLFIGIPVILVFFVSFLIPIYAPQRLLFTLPIFYLLLAIGAKSLKRYGWLPLVVVLGISVYSSYLYQSQPRFQREKWREAVAYVETTRTSRSVALFAFPEPFAPWQWYSRGVLDELAVAPELVVKKAQLVNYRYVLAQADRIYYFHYLTDLTDPQRMIPIFLNELGYLETAKTDFSGVGFVSIYEKAMAAI